MSQTVLSAQQPLTQGDPCHHHIEGVKPRLQVKKKDPEALTR